jgi:hypothetical protein
VILPLAICVSRRKPYLLRERQQGAVGGRSAARSRYLRRTASSSWRRTRGSTRRLCRVAYVAVAALTLPLALGACGSDLASDTVGKQKPIATSRHPSSPTTAPRSQNRSSSAAQPVTETDFNPSSFDRSTTISNEWLPLSAGTQLVLEGSAIEDGERVRHAIVSTVSDLTKSINGVRTVVLWEKDYSNGQLVEAELSFFAQDNDGNVWNFGEYPEEYDRGSFVKAPTWLAGLQDAKAGIAMRVHPRMRTSSYAQGWGPKVDWTDRASVLLTGQRTCVPVGCYRGVLVTAEAARDELNSHQLKYYARGVGNVRVGWQGRDETQETLALAKAAHLSPAALATVRAEALKMERHAYVVSKDAYAHTSPSR